MTNSEKPGQDTAGVLSETGVLDLGQRPSGTLLESFVDLLAASDDAIRECVTPEESFDRIFGRKAARILGFRKGYVAAIDLTEDNFQIIRLIMPNEWERDDDKDVIERWVGTKRPIKTSQGRLVEKLVTEKRSYITPDFGKDINFSQHLRKSMRLKTVIASPFVVFNEVVGYLLLGYRRFPPPEVQWMHEHLVAHAAVTAMQSFWAAKFRREVELSMKWKLLGQQAGALMHDMNTPIGTLNNCIEILTNQKSVSDQNRNLLRTASAQVRRIQFTMANLLSFVRVIDLRRSSIQVRKLLQDARASSLADAASARITGGALERSVYIDPLKMNLVLRNLINNAFETPLRAGANERLVEIRAEGDDEELTLSVLDNGQGLSDQVIEHLFEPFVSTKKHGQGLGLAVAERLIGAHGGRIRARNRSEGGACFEIILPWRTAKKGAQDG